MYITWCGSLNSQGRVNQERDDILAEGYDPPFVLLLQDVPFVGLRSRILTWLVANWYGLVYALQLDGTYNERRK